MEGRKGLNNTNSKEEEMDGKRGQFRFPLGALDLVSAILVVLGMFLIQSGSPQLGWLFIIGGVFKQFSGL